MADELRVNGNIYSWGSIRVKLDGQIYTGFTSIAYGDSRERVKAYGMGAHHAPRGRSRGKYSTDPVKLGGPKESLEALREALAQRSPDGISYGDVEFEIIVQYAEPGKLPITVTIEQCVWTKDSAQDEESADPGKGEAEFDCMRIRRNGKTLFDSSQGTP